LKQSIQSILTLLTVTLIPNKQEMTEFADKNKVRIYPFYSPSRWPLLPFAMKWSLKCVQQSSILWAAAFEDLPLMNKELLIFCSQYRFRTKKYVQVYRKLIAICYISNYQDISVHY